MELTRNWRGSKLRLDEVAARPIQTSASTLVSSQRKEEIELIRKVFEVLKNPDKHPEVTVIYSSDDIGLRRHG